MRRQKALVPSVKRNIRNSSQTEMASSSDIQGHGLADHSSVFCIRIATFEDIKDGKELPAAVVKKYGDVMGQVIFLNVPKREKPLAVNMRKTPCGKQIWLEKGWEAFTNLYLLEEGDLVMFNYKGEHSHFRLNIIGWNDVEIDYPLPGSEARAIQISSGSSSDDEEEVARGISFVTISSGDED